MSTGGSGADRQIRAIVAASEDRAKRVVEEMRRGAWLVELVRVDDAASLDAAIKSRIWDVVVADATLSELPPLRVMDTLRQLHRSVPVVVLSGTTDVGAVTEVMRAGARDVVPFDDLTRLNTIIRREVLVDTPARNLREVMRAGLIHHSGAIGMTLASFDGRFLDANDAFLSIVGYSREELLAGRVRRETITPPEYEHADSAAVDTLKSTGGLELRQKEYVRKDGVRVPVLVTGLQLDEGTVVGFIVVDLTEQRRIERELRSATVFLDSIIENIPLVVFVKDAEQLRYERLNQAAERLLGRGREELLGKNDYDLFPKEQADSFQRTDREAMAAESSLEISEAPIVTPAGQRWMRTMKMAIRDESGRPTHLLGIAEDVTARKATADELVHTEALLVQAQKVEAVGQLAGGVAHDFNNLLAVILSYAELVAEALREGDPLRADIVEITKAGERAAALTRQLLAFARKEAARPCVLDVNAVIAGVERLLERVVEESIDLRIVCEPGLWRVAADPTQIEQVILNLVVNARDAMPSGGKLTIETSNVEVDHGFAQLHVGMKPGPHVVLAVRDTGVGMDAATVAHIFEPFFTTKGIGRGTGLGLSTVFGVVKQSNGTITVDSAPSMGTTFKVYLPRTEAVARPMSNAPPPTAARRGTATILVVEDDDQLRRLVTSVLRREGYEVLDASSPADALLLSEQHAGVIHLLLTDVVMPRMNGGQLAKRLTGTRPAMKVVFMSGHPPDVVLHHGVLDAGFVLIAKPFTASGLLAKVGEVLDAASPSLAL